MCCCTFRKYLSNHRKAFQGGGAEPEIPNDSASFGTGTRQDAASREGDNVLESNLQPSSTSPQKLGSSAATVTKTGFDFTAHMRSMIEDAISRLPELQHIDLSRVAITFSQARKRVAHGLFATLTPMRFENGARTGLRNGRRWRAQEILGPDKQEMLYILSFYLPRFMDVDFQEKLVTIFHELWHISPEFNGDLRRHPGRCYAHTHSQREYDARMAVLASKWLRCQPPEYRYQFLKYRFQELQNHYGRIYGLHVTQPKLIPID